MAYYIKATKSVAAHMGLLKDREQTADGNYLLWQADIQDYQGKSIYEQAEKIGGAVLTPEEAKMEHDGTVKKPAKVTDPFKGNNDTEENTTNPDGENTDTDEKGQDPDTSENGDDKEGGDL